jgi:hypothetical protein
MCANCQRALHELRVQRGNGVIDLPKLERILTRCGEEK